MRLTLINYMYPLEYIYAVNYMYDWWNQVLDYYGRFNAWGDRYSFVDTPEQKDEVDKVENEQRLSVLFPDVVTEARVKEY